MVEEYENNIIPPPTEFRDKPIPAPRTKKTIERPVAVPRTKIKQRKKVLKGFTKSFLVCRPTVGRLSADSWPTVGGGELFFTFTKKGTAMQAGPFLMIP